LEERDLTSIHPDTYRITNRRYRCWSRSQEQARLVWDT